MSKLIEGALDHLIKTKNELEEELQKINDAIDVLGGTSSVKTAKPNSKSRTPNGKSKKKQKRHTYSSEQKNQFINSITELRKNKTPWKKILRAVVKIGYKGTQASLLAMHTKYKDASKEAFDEIKEKDNGHESKKSSKKESVKSVG